MKLETVAEPLVLLCWCKKVTISFHSNNTSLPYPQWVWLCCVFASCEN